MRFDESLLVGGDVLLDGNGLILRRGAEAAKRGLQLVKVKMKALCDEGEIGVDVMALLAHQEAGD